MRPLALILLAVVLVACEDVDRFASPTQVPFAGVTLASSDSRVGEAPVTTAVAGVSVRRERADGPMVIVMPPRTAATPVPKATPVPTVVAGVVARRGTPALDRRAAATATAVAARGRGIRAGVADELRQARAGTVPAAGALDDAAAVRDAIAAASSSTVGAGELARLFSGLPRDEARCSELALVERSATARLDTSLPLAGSAQTEILLERLQAGCLPDGAALTPELARALAARPPAALGGLTTADPLARQAAPTDRDRTDPFTQDADPAAPALAPQPARAPLFQTRPGYRDTVRSANGTGP